MGKVNYIKKCRKEQKCSKCGREIAAGSPYWKGELFRMPPIVRCTACGLKHYEVTTSDYVRTIGRIVEDWEEEYGVGECTIESIVNDLQEVLDTCQDNLENIPEQLQEGSAGQLLKERIEELESAIDELECADWNSFLEKGYDNLCADEQETLDAEQEKRNGEDFDCWYGDFCEGGSELAQIWTEQVAEELVSFVNDALGILSY